MTKSRPITFNLTPYTPADMPDPSLPEFADFLDAHFEAGEKLINSMDEWSKQSKAHDGNTQIVSLPSGKVRKSLGINDFWCGRISTVSGSDDEPCLVDVNYDNHDHDADQVRASVDKHEHGSTSLFRTLSNKLRRNSEQNLADRPANQERRPTFELDDVERQERIMSKPPQGLYERFRRGLLEYHSENEREYIESCRETSCLQVYQSHVAEVWRLTYVTPMPTSPRTFVVLLLSRELKSTPHGHRSFMNISVPFIHPDCPEKAGDEKPRVRGKYVSVERVTERADTAGDAVEWRMATSSDAGGNIPRFVVNSSLPGKISEDVPSFLSWLVHKQKDGGWRKSVSQ